MSVVVTGGDWGWADIPETRAGQNAMSGQWEELTSPHDPVVGATGPPIYKKAPQVTGGAAASATGGYDGSDI